MNAQAPAGGQTQHVYEGKPDSRQATDGQKEPAEPLLQFFEFSHLPPHLQAVSGNFCDLAHTIVAVCPRNPERTVALRKLLEAKDCAVRAVLWK